MRAIWLAAAVLAVAAGEGSAQSAGTPLAPESRVWFTGSSNLRHFTCRARSVSGSVGEGEAVVTVDAARFGCGIAAQNRHLRETLKARENPTIELHLTGWTIAADSAATLRGRLRIAGVEREVTLAARTTRDALGRLHVSGAEPLRVTDYGVVPPRRFLGALRVRDTVTIHWDVVLADGTPRVAGVAHAPK